MFGKFDLFEDVVDKQTLKIKNYELAYKLKRYLECDDDFNVYADRRDIGIIDYVSSMRFAIESKHKPSLIYRAIILLENDLPPKRVADITGLDIQLIEKLEVLQDNEIDTQGERIVTLEEKYEIANDLLKLDYLKVEDIAKKTKLTVGEVEALKAINS